MIPTANRLNPLVHNHAIHVRRETQGWLRLTAAAAAAFLWMTVPAIALEGTGGLGASVAAQESARPRPAEPVAQAQPAGPAARGEGHGVPARDQHAAGAGQEGHGEEQESESPWGLVGRLFNFAVLAGGLVYLLRSPFVSYLRARAVTIRADLRQAAELKEAASIQLSETESRIRALPGEIESLARRGADEISAEQARILAAAEAERLRMLEQSRREVDLQVRLARRTLRRRAGELAVDIATERVKRSITDADHARLVDRYLAQVERPTGGWAKGRPS